MEIFLGITVFTWNVLSIKNFCFEMGERFFFEAGTLYFIGYKDLKREILMVERNYLLLYKRMNRLIFDEKLEKIWNALLNMFV